MDREQIIRMAREAGFKVDWQHPSVAEIKAKRYEYFAALVAAAEREACCSGEVLNAANINGGDHPHQVIEKYQAAIRARGNT